MKATAVAPSNIAFIKYWGKKDEKRKIPLNGSVSMNLSSLLTTTTVEFDKNYKKDEIIINNKFDKTAQKKVSEHLDKIRKMAKIDLGAKVVSHNNFPKSTGLSSSASGFAALSLAGSKAAGLELSEKELSVLARQGSGSACRSIPDGIVEWISGSSNNDSYAKSIFPPKYWDILDIVVIVSKKNKEVATTDGQKLVGSSPFIFVRMRHIKDKIKKIKKFIKERDFVSFGNLIEKEALELHSIMLTSSPPLIYFLPETVRVMKAVHAWRRQGLNVFFTVNTGQNIHIICRAKDKEIILKKINEISDVKDMIINHPERGSYITNKHLF